MGACLSKKGNKGRDGEDQDAMPYTKASPRKDPKKQQQKGGDCAPADEAAVTTASPSLAAPEAVPSGRREEGSGDGEEAGTKLDKAKVGVA